MKLRGLYCGENNISVNCCRKRFLLLGTKQLCPITNKFQEIWRHHLCCNCDSRKINSTYELTWAEKSSCLCGWLSFLGLLDHRFKSMHTWHVLMIVLQCCVLFSTNKLWKKWNILIKYLQLRPSDPWSPDWHAVHLASHPIWTIPIECGTGGHETSRLSRIVKQDKWHLILCGLNYLMWQR